MSWKNTPQDKLRQKEYNKQYYLKNKEKIRKQQEEYWNQNREKIIKHKREYHRKNGIKRKYDPIKAKERRKTQKYKQMSRARDHASWFFHLPHKYIRQPAHCCIFHCSYSCSSKLSLDYYRVLLRVRSH